MPLLPLRGGDWFESERGQTFDRENLMLEMVTKNRLTDTERSPVDALIRYVWKHEENSRADVEVFDQAKSESDDALDRNAVHVLVWDNQNLVGYGRVTLFLSRSELIEAPREVPSLPLQISSAAFLSRLVVHPKWRGQGIGGRIDQQRIHIARKCNVDVILGCAVGDKRQKALQTSGFVTEGQIASFQTPWYRTSRNVALMKLDLAKLTLQKTYSL